MIVMLAHAALATAVLIQQPPVPLGSAQAEQSRHAIRFSLPDVPAPKVERSISRTPWSVEAKGSNLPESRNASRARKWAPWIGAAVGATAIGVGVADEKDLVFTGKLMWVGIGAAVGAGVGWLIGRMAGL